MKLRRILLAAAAVGILTATTAAPAAAETPRQRGWNVQFATPDGWFRAVIVDPASVARIDAALEAGERYLGIPNGVMVRGNGGVNRGHDWHLVDVELVDMTIELCDGTAAYVDEHLDDWMREVGRYCPWSAELVSLRTVFV